MSVVIGGWNSFGTVSNSFGLYKNFFVAFCLYNSRSWFNKRVGDASTPETIRGGGGCNCGGAIMVSVAVVVGL